MNIKYPIVKQDQLILYTVQYRTYQILKTELLSPIFKFGDFAFLSPNCQLGTQIFLGTYMLVWAPKGGIRCPHLNMEENIQFQIILNLQIIKGHSYPTNLFIFLLVSLRILGQIQDT